ncbi:MAG: phosphate ABC transporter permease subunit PstC [Deltaproteobacteria bacterium]|nr:phosphate ABC transporter permease subunit PstC [Deltaproteobacteria bacterium]
MNHTDASVAVPTARCKMSQHSKRGLSEASFRKILYFAGLSMLVLLAAIFFSLLIASIPALRQFGLSFLINTTWDPVRNEFGAMAFLVGTLMSSFLALLIAMVFSLPVSIFLGEYFRYGAASTFMKSVIELLAGIPSVIYGFWGLFLLVPLVRALEVKLGVAPQGVGIFTSSLVLAVMIIPYASSIGTEVISLVPADLKEAALSLGATRFEVIRRIVLPYAYSGIFAGILLALGRALGETMAVTMVIGNSNFLPKSIFSPGNTMASVIANEFTEATGSLYLASLIELALVLFLATTIINILGKLVIRRMSARK